MSYLKRCGCVMLACVLCFCLLQPPRAKAVAGVLVAGAAVTAAPIGSVIATIVLTAVGVDFLMGMAGVGPEGGITHTGAYEVGSVCWQAMEAAGGAITQWCEEVNARFQAKGGFDAMDELLIPAEVAEFARTWANTQYDFSSGEVVFNQAGIFSSNGQFLYATLTNNYEGDAVKPISLGTVVRPGETVTFPSGVVLTVTSEVSAGGTGKYAYKIRYNMNNSLDPYFSASSAFYCYPKTLEYGGFVFSIVENEFHYGHYGSWKDSVIARMVTFSSPHHFPISKLGEKVDLSTTMTKTPELDKPQEDDIPAILPDVPFEMVKDLSVPAIGSLTREDVVAGEVVEPTAPPKPTTVPGEATDAKVGDLELDKVKQQQGSLGALFISKFPFSIPWDFAAAVELLAAPPKVPHWEVDFLAPVAHRVGGWKGDTTIVVDLSEYEVLGSLCRWVTTIMFCAALAMGTKRLLWTA